MAVEQDRYARGQVAHERQAGRQLVDDEGAWPKGRQLTGGRYGQEEVEVAEDGAEDGESVQDGHGDEGRAADANVESALRK